MTVRANAPARMGSGFQNTRGSLIFTIQIDFNKMPNEWTKRAATAFPVQVELVIIYSNLFGNILSYLLLYAKVEVSKLLILLVHKVMIHFEIILVIKVYTVNKWYK